MIRQEWSVVIGLTSSALRSAKPLLIALGVKASENSPLSRDFQTTTELRYVFIKYLSCTFKYSDVNGAGDNVLAEEEGDDAPSMPKYNVITAKRI